MKRAARVLLLAGLPFLGCGDQDSVGGPNKDGAGPVDPASGGKVPLAAWVDKMVADENEPDTVDDKVGIVIDTDDESAFDKLLK